MLVRGHLINLIFISLFIILTIIQRFLLDRENRKRQELQKLGTEEGQQSLEQDTRIGDEALDYTYKL